jgi:hypothetical protein
LPTSSPRAKHASRIRPIPALRTPVPFVSHDGAWAPGARFWPSPAKPVKAVVGSGRVDLYRVSPPQNNKKSVGWCGRAELRARRTSAHHRNLLLASSYALARGVPFGLHSFSARRSQCGLTLRSSGPTTAGGVSMGRGTLCIFPTQAYTAYRSGPLTSNVRPHVSEDGSFALMAAFKSAGQPPLASSASFAMPQFQPSPTCQHVPARGSATKRFGSIVVRSFKTRGAAGEA